MVALEVSVSDSGSRGWAFRTTPLPSVPDYVLEQVLFCTQEMVDISQHG